MTAWTADDVRGLRIANVSDAELTTIHALLEVWRVRLAKNMKRSLYYDTEQAFQDLGIALPPQLRHARFYLAWAKKAVRAPAMRSQFDGFRLPGSDDPFELGEILAQNRFPLEFGQAITSAYTHGMSLVVVSRGVPGEPDVQIQAHAADMCAALWDHRKRRVKAALTIGRTKSETPIEFTVYLDDVVLECTYSKGSGWSAERTPHTLGRVPAVPVTNDPQLRRPFGVSRLTNSVMALTDMAVRGHVRMEANAEFYSTPQIALLGVDAEAFSSDMTESKKFKLAMDRLLALTKDQDGDKPDLRQLAQATMTPHSDMLRTIAMAFSAETGLSPSSLGVVHDQPASAEAIRAGERELLIDVSYQNRYVLSDSARQIAELVVMIRDELTEPPEEMWGLSTRFLDEEFPAMSAQSDSVQKLAASMTDISQYDVLMEQIFDEDQIERIKADNRTSAVSEFMANVTDRAETQRVAEAAQAGVATVGAAASAMDPQDLKARFDALGVAIRSGVEPEDAANRLGLQGIKFTGAVPVSLRVPEDQTGELEEK